MLLLLCAFTLAVSQLPTISVCPDSIPLYLQQYDHAIDSFKITNRGGDTLHYVLSTRYGKKAIEGHSTLLLGTPNQTADSLVRGTVLQATEDLYVSEFSYGFESASPVHVEFFVFEADSDTGRYRKIFSRTQQFDSISRETEVSSGTVNVRIDSGQYCIVGVSWDNPLTFAASTGGCCGNDAASLVYKGSFVQSQSYPSDTAYSVSSIQNSGVAYDMSLVVCFPLFLNILSDSFGYVPPNESTTVKFEARTGSHSGANLLTYVEVLSDDPMDSLLRVAVISPLITGIRPSSDSPTPLGFTLNQNYPNPINPFTTISFSIPKQSWVTMEIFNLLGQKVITLVSEVRPAGLYNVQWGASNCTSGIYYCRLQAGAFVAVKKLLLVR